MNAFRAACVQMRSGKNPSENSLQASALIKQAAADGATYIQTPEMTNLLVGSKAELLDRISAEWQDVSLKAFKRLADELSIWLHIGSLAVLREDGKIVNRAFVISPEGSVAVRYDKIHMFDVDLPGGESWRESATYQPGNSAVCCDLPWIRFGVAICYDIRFPTLFRAQAKAGAFMLTAPAAFTQQTGQAHWHVLQRARAIENTSFVVSAAQGGLHEDGRETYGHSIIVSPWGDVLAELDNNEPGYMTAMIDPESSTRARQRIPSLQNDKEFEISGDFRAAETRA